ncbi:MAG: guanylate kinase [Clostridium sp.]|nr:guanylate kinase [Clostridium sp.]
MMGTKTYQKGILAVVSGPSGAGKGTILKLLKDSGDKVKFSISATTRNIRKGEVDQQNYFFKTQEQFKSMIEENELLEWVEYCGNFYGTPKEYVEKTIAKGYDCLLEIEVEGAENIKKIYPDSVSVFILPPTFDDLRKRIEKRGTEGIETILKRIERAKEEMIYISNYDYIVINDNPEEAVQQLRYILGAEKLRLHRNSSIIEKFR